jgi:GNAT superfamily N-acetyltransferase
MNETGIRVARDADLQALVAALGQEAFFADRLERQRREQGELFIAWRDGVPVGDVYLWRAQPYEELVRQHLGWTPTITHLEVDPAWQNRGIGTALVRAAEAFATRLGYWRMCLGVDVGNPDARRLYERLGYTQWQHGPVDVHWEEDGVEQAMTCHWMVRSLPGEAPGPDDWKSWDPTEAAAVLRDSTVDWYVAGGWAIDLHLGYQSRHHEDLEVAIVRADLPRWREHLSDFELYHVGAGRVRRLRPGDEPDPAGHQIWVCDPGERQWRMDTFLEERPSDEWACHWLPRIRVPIDEAIAHTADGLAYLRPEYTLLGKAKHTRPKDLDDLERALPTMDSRARERLRGGLREADPDHPWLRYL